MSEFLEPDQFSSSPAEPEIEIYSEPPASRIPHLGHALLFFSIAALLFMGIARIVILLFHATTRTKAEALMLRPRFSVTTEAVAYLLTLGLAWLIFSRLWERPFWAGLQWNFEPVRRLSWRLVALGVTLSYVSEGIRAVLSKIHAEPTDMPLNKIFDTHSAADLWLLTIFGIFLGPLFEEVCFRGFLLPAIAISWDWLWINRKDSSAVVQWHMTDTLSRTGLILGSVISSIFFVGLHAPQLAYSVGVLTALFCVSMTFSYMRVRYNSLAVTYVMHASYNSAIFFVMLVATHGYRNLDQLNR